MAVAKSKIRLQTTLPRSLLPIIAKDQREKNITRSEVLTRIIEEYYSKKAQQEAATETE